MPFFVNVLWKNKKVTVAATLKYLSDVEDIAIKTWQKLFARSNDYSLQDGILIKKVLSTNNISFISYDSREFLAHIPKRCSKLRHFKV